jgi:prepilin-type N-terminal cleavage/methylation domain-containing protein
MEARRLRRRSRAGFTLIEVLIAMVILAVMVVSAQAVLTDTLVTRVGGVDRRMVGVLLASERLQTVQAEPSYSELAGRYQSTESTVAGYPGYSRTTQVARTFNAQTGLDYTTITVTVTHPQLSDAISRVAVVAAP